MCRARAVVFAVAALAGCKSSRDSQDRHASDGSGSGVVFAGDASREVTGTLVVDGKPQLVTECRPGHSTSTYVELVATAGKLRFENKALYWTAKPHDLSPGQRLDCEKLDRSWGGGLRGDGSSYFRGKLDFACTGKQVVVTGELQLDCGNITALERAQLDRNSAAMKAEQAQRRQQGSGSGSHLQGSAAP